MQRRQFSRTQSNASQLPTTQQRHTHRQHRRSTNEKANNTVDATTRPPPIERRSSRQPQNGVTVSHQQRSRKAT